MVGLYDRYMQSQEKLEKFKKFNRYRRLEDREKIFHSSSIDGVNDACRDDKLVKVMSRCRTC